MIEHFDFVGADERVKKYILPKKVLAVGGNVCDTDNLLLKKSPQIGFLQDGLTILKNTEEGERAWILLDFGCEFHGGIRIMTSQIKPSKSPLRVRLTFGESVGEALSNIGQSYAGNDHSPRDFEVCVSQWSDLDFGQTGFRFVRIELLDRVAEWKIKSIHGVFVYRDLPYIGSFECSDKRLNEIYNTAAYTCHLNMQTMLWDGIKRDRLVWVGDTHPEMLAIKTLFGRHSIVEENLRFSRDETPLPGWMNHLISYSFWWLILLYDWCYSVDDFSLAEESSDYIQGLLKQILSNIDSSGNHNFPDYFLDWNTRGKPEAKAGVHALMYLALRAGERLCLREGANDLANRCTDTMKLLKKNIPDPANSTEANSLLLFGNLGDASHAVKTLLENGADGMSTLLSYYTLTALANNGQVDAAIDMLKTYYGGMLDMGATTFWENFHMYWTKNSSRIDAFPEEGKFDVHGAFGEHCYKGFRHSLCHGWSAGPVAFLAEQILGIRVIEAGGGHIHLSPNLCHMEYAKGAYPTKYGKVEVAYEKKGDRIVLTHLKAPKQCGLSMDQSIKIGTLNNNMKEDII